MFFIASCVYQFHAVRLSIPCRAFINFSAVSLQRPCWLKLQTRASAFSFAILPASWHVCVVNQVSIYQQIVSYRCSCCKDNSNAMGRTWYTLAGNNCWLHTTPPIHSTYPTASTFYIPQSYNYIYICWQAFFCKFMQSASANRGANSTGLKEKKPETLQFSRCIKCKDWWVQTGNWPRRT